MHNTLNLSENTISFFICEHPETFGVCHKYMAALEQQKHLLVKTCPPITLKLTADFAISFLTDQLEAT